MSDELLDRVHQAALRLCALYDIESDLTGAKAIVSFDDERCDLIEHVCHELSHAALLRIPFRKSLPDHVATWLGLLPAGTTNQNEVDTFAVVMLVFDELGLGYDRDNMLHGAFAQVPWDEHTITTRWKTRRSDPDVEEAVGAVLAAFQPS